MLFTNSSVVSRIFSYTCILLWDRLLEIRDSAVHRKRQRCRVIMSDDSGVDVGVQGGVW